VKVGKIDENRWRAIKSLDARTLRGEMLYRQCQKLVRTIKSITGDDKRETASELGRFAARCYKIKFKRYKLRARSHHGNTSELDLLDALPLL
jgi:hypothetical protein